ncbi:MULTISPECIES: YbfB/YjiJ family MFS transporter [Shouchella]|uniref:YbfB/YjiJ family MFS transporter n=2 Tax=Shouchella TaxID=2893057 RepID=A0ABY7WDC1_9BACI|nr:MULTISPECIES: YbfB/YjiJ family MFS transporter [Shouchella]MED4128026.1 YbfB/YjiJ family MFS transporter [Shouchella miscanthi]WDF05653.1 YbfB/YjiJ family MFS transporter [Shouchella hunanensis]
MNNRETLRLIVIGFFSLTIVIGIGRFLYTPILPYMEVDTSQSFSALGMLATWNYIGYFIGAFVSRKVQPTSKAVILLLFINALTTVLMGLFDDHFMWILLRFLSGISSGFIFVLATNLVLGRLVQQNKTQYAGYLYSGVGFGILLTGTFTPFTTNSVNWSFTWLFFGFISLLLTVVITLIVKKMAHNKTQMTFSVQPQYKYQGKKKKTALYLSYLFEGFGYIIYATFITGLLTHNSFSLEASYVWAVVGLGAIPSCIIWSWLGKIISDSRALKYAYFIQILSVFIPVLSQHLLLIIVSAFLFGATFLGIITLTMSISKQFKGSKNLVSGLTVIYAFGQIIGPSVAGIFIEFIHFQFSFLLAGFALVLSFIVVTVSFRSEVPSHSGFK